MSSEQISNILALHLLQRKLFNNYLQINNNVFESYFNRKIPTPSNEIYIYIYNSHDGIRIVDISKKSATSNQIVLMKLFLIIFSMRHEKKLLRNSKRLTLTNT